MVKKVTFVGFREGDCHNHSLGSAPVCKTEAGYSLHRNDNVTLLLGQKPSQSLALKTNLLSPDELPI